MGFRAKIGALICAATITWPASGYGVVITLANTGVVGTPATGGTSTPAAPTPVYLTGIPTYGPVSHAPASADTDTHEGVTWGDALSTDLLDVGRAKLGLKYYGATTGSGTTHGVGFSITIPQ